MLTMFTFLCYHCLHRKKGVIMKLIFITMIFVSSLFSHSLEVNILNIQNIKGKIYIGVYDKKEGFGILNKQYIGVIQKITNDTLKYTFVNISSGTYAISVFQDENENDILDKNFFGKPTEAYGFSNNIRHTFSSATFDESKFQLNNNKSISINIE